MWAGMKVPALSGSDSMHDAVAQAKERSTQENVRVVRYHRPLDYVANVYAKMPRRPGNVNLINLDLPTLWSLTTPRFMYLWAPGG